MTAGDVVVGLQNVAAYNDLVFRPAANVEVLITNTACVVPTWCGLTNGGQMTIIINFNAAVNQSFLGKIFINNSVYLAIRNNSAGAFNVSYCGIQTK